MKPVNVVPKSNSLLNELNDRDWNWGIEIDQLLLLANVTRMHTVDCVRIIDRIRYFIYRRWGRNVHVRSWWLCYIMYECPVQSNIIIIILLIILSYPMLSCNNPTAYAWLYTWNYSRIFDNFRPRRWGEDYSVDWKNAGPDSDAVAAAVGRAAYYHERPLEGYSQSLSIKRFVGNQVSWPGYAVTWGRVKGDDAKLGLQKFMYSLLIRMISIFQLHKRFSTLQRRTIW